MPLLQMALPAFESALAGVILCGITPQGLPSLPCQIQKRPIQTRPIQTRPPRPLRNPRQPTSRWNPSKIIFSEYEQSHSRKKEASAQGREGTVIAVTADSIVLDIGFKTEGVLPLTAFPADKLPKPGDKVQVTIKGRDHEGYYELTRGKVEHPTDWASLEKAFAEKSTIVGTVTGVVKGGLSVDIGVRAFMPASRSGTKDAAELEKLVEQEIRCRIIKLDVDDEDVVVDRRAIAEDEERAGKSAASRNSRKAIPCTAKFAASPITERLSISVAPMRCCMSAKFPGIASTSPPTCFLSGQQIEAMIIKIEPRSTALPSA